MAGLGTGSRWHHASSEQRGKNFLERMGFQCHLIKSYPWLILCDKPIRFPSSSNGCPVPFLTWQVSLERHPRDLQQTSARAPCAQPTANCTDHPRIILVMLHWFLYQLMLSLFLYSVLSGSHLRWTNRQTTNLIHKAFEQSESYVSYTTRYNVIHRNFWMV